MSPFRMGFQVWGMSVFLNAIYLGFVGLIMSSGFNILLSFVVLIAGLFVGLPFLVLLVQLIKLARRLPYSISARICWLSFWMSFSVWLFYSAISFLIGGKFFDADLWQFAGITIAAFITSVCWSRKLFREIEGMNEYSIN